MKKIKLLTSLASLPLLGATVLPIVSCGNNTKEECTITLTSSVEGTLSQKSVKVYKGKKWQEVKTTIPQPLCNVGFKFKEWVIDGQSIKDSYVISNDITLSAAYEASERCDITFQKGDHGSIDVTSIKINKGTKWKDVVKPKVTADYSYDFDKWVDSDGNEIADDSVINTNFVAKATYTNATYTIKFVDDAHSVLTESTGYIAHGKTWGDVKKPKLLLNKGYTLDKWVDEDGVELTNDRKIYYHFTAKAICHEANFFTDHWENICYYADQGLDKLKEVYGINSFIGLERTITINGSVHVVRVIDENHDKLTGLNKTAALTFESVTLLSDSKGHCIISKWDASTNQSYKTSILYNAFNSENEVTTWIRKPNTSDGKFENKSIYTLLKQAGITPKQVDKAVALGSTYSTDTPYSCYVFPLSFAEIGQTGSSKAKVEGSVYKYWAEHNNDDARIKYDVEGKKPFNYWLVSPDIEQSNYSWQIGSIGNTLTATIADQSSTSVSFAFCI